MTAGGDMGGGAYGLLMIAGILVSLATWGKLAGRDRRMPLIYCSALVGALIGAKVAYLAAEGWLYLGHSGAVAILFTGKSITGAILGGWLGVEAAKKATGFTSPTGDFFAVAAPLGIVLGRVGCIFHGCCNGVALGECGAGELLPDWALGPGRRWPATWTELTFNLLAAGVAFSMGRRKILVNQHFHLYLIAYGIFRFFHEFLRDTPKVFLSLSGYQLISLCMAGAGLAGFLARRRAQGGVTRNPQA